MKTEIISLLIISFFVFSSIPEILAQSPTPDEKVKEIREAVKEKVREEIQQTQKGQKKAFVGEITEISNSTLVLEARSGEQQAEIDDEATILNIKKSKIEFEDLEIGNYVIAMGYLGENEILQAKRVVVTKEPKTSTRQVVVGRVTDISDDEKIITVKNEKKGVVYMVEATSKTTITQKLEEDEIEEVKFGQIEEGDWLVTIGTPTENEEKIITAKLIHLVPDKNKPEPTPTPEEESTPSPASEE